MESHNAQEEKAKENPTKADTGIKVTPRKEPQKGKEKVEEEKAKGRDTDREHLSTANVGIVVRPDTWQEIVIAGKQKTKHSNRTNKK
jgi:hypothetical protein